MKKIINIGQLLLLLLLFATSCNEDIMNFKNQNAYSADTYFNTPDEIAKGVIAAYGSFYFNSTFNWKLPELLDCMANEVEATPAAAANEQDIMAFYRYEFNNTTGPVAGYWRVLYKMILRSNLVIEKANAYLTNKGDDAIVNRSLGEAYFLRGWAYSQLAFYYGRVPLRLTFDQTGVEDAPRTNTVKEVWDVAEADFKMAKDLLPEVSSYSSADLGRASKGAAIGFLGKLYLYNKDYAKADAEFALLNGKYSLLPVSRWGENFDEINENNEESIFEIQFQYFVGGEQFVIFGDPEGRPNTGSSNCHEVLYGWSQDIGGWDNWRFQPRRVKDFQYKDENNVDFIDPRAPLTFYGGIGDNTILDNSADGPQPYTYANTNPQIYYYKKNMNLEYKKPVIPSGINTNLMRYADVILMRAECKLETGDIPGCLSFINQVRERIGAFKYLGTYSKEQAFELLKRERLLEFMGEQVRYNDLRRWGILEATMNPELQAVFGIQTVTAKHYLWPIPQLEIDTNLGLGSVDNNWN
jgi:hypothetical protein